MEYEYEDVLEKIGDMGTYQKRMMAIVFFPVLFGSISSSISNFIVGDHKHR